MHLILRGITAYSKTTKLVTIVFVAFNRNVQPIETAAEIVTDIPNRYRAKLLHYEPVRFANLHDNNLLALITPALIGVNFGLLALLGPA